MPITGCFRGVRPGKRYIRSELVLESLVDRHFIVEGFCSSTELTR